MTTAKSGWFREVAIPVALETALIADRAVAVQGLVLVGDMEADHRLSHPESNGQHPENERVRCCEKCVSCAAAQFEFVSGCSYLGKRPGKVLVARQHPSHHVRLGE
jgi:hypothetical protein